MVLATYASLLEEFSASDFSVSPTSGGSAASPTSFYYFACGLSRGGINRLTPLGQVSVGSGEKLQFTINATARPDGLDPFAFVLGAATTNNPTLCKILAVAWVIEADQETQRALPLTIELTTDQDFVLGGSVADFGSLPSSPVNGCVRFVEAESKYYQYDSEGWYLGDSNPVWRQVYGDRLYLSNTTTLRSGTQWKGGCDVPIPNIPVEISPEFYGIITAPWAGEGDPSPPIKLWLLNGLLEGTGNVVPQDSQISLIAKINGNIELGRNLSDEILLDGLQLVRRLDGQKIGINGGSLTWNSADPFYFLESDLNPGYAFEVSCVVSATVGNGDRITLYLNDDGVFGSSTKATFLGEAIFSSGNKARIVPDLVGIKRLSGSGLIITNNQASGYIFNTNSELGLTLGLISDAASQKVGISGLRNGAIAIHQEGSSLPATEALRAVISTEPGTATASDWSSPVAVGANGRLEVTISLPSSIRENYPDLAIAGNTEAVRNTPELILYVIVSSIITQLSPVVVESDAEQIVVVDDLSTGVVVGSVPDNPQSDFNLWGYGDIIPVASGSGSLSAGNYQVKIAWHYPSPNLAITKISHDTSDGCIVELSRDFAEATFLSDIFSEIQVEGAAQSQRKILDFDSRLIEITDEPSNNKLKLQLPNVSQTFVTNTNPTASDDSSAGYSVGDNWVNTNSTPIGFFHAESVAIGAASWVSVGSGGGGGAGITAVNDLAALKTLTGVASDATYLVKINSISGLNNNIYRFDSTSTATADNNAVIEPNSGSGRWLKIGKLNTSEIIEVPDKNFATDAELAAIASNTAGLANKSNTNHTHLSTKGTLLVGDGTGQVALPTGTTGQFLEYDSASSFGVSWVDSPTSAFTTTQASFVQPALNGTVTVAVGSSANFVAGLSYVSMVTGGLYLVTDTPTGTTMSIEYKGGGAAPTSSVASGKKIVAAGSQGTDGENARTATTSDFTVPAVDGTVDISVISSAIFNPSINIDIDSAGDYQITAIPDSTTITAKNLGETNNAAPGVTINSGSQVIITGRKGNPSDTKQLLVSANDTTEGYLEDKLVDSNGVSFATQNDGGNETITLAIDHDAINNYLLNEHIDHSTVTISAGTGLTGGGNLTDNRTISLDLNGLAAKTTPVSGDYVPLIDSEDSNNPKKVLFTNFAGGDTDTKQLLVSANDTTQGYLETKLVAGNNITLVTNEDGANESITISSSNSGIQTVNIENSDLSLAITDNTTGGNVNYSINLNDLPISKIINLSSQLQNIENSQFSGSYTDLTNKPTSLPSEPLNTITRYDSTATLTLTNSSENIITVLQSCIINLPSNPTIGKPFTINNANDSNTITINENIDNTSIELSFTAQNKSAKCIFDGTEWLIYLT